MGKALLNAVEMRNVNMLRVLAVGTTMEDQTSLRWMFSHSKWALFRTPTTGEAMRFLTTHRIGVVLAPEAALPNGDNWRFLWEWMLPKPLRPELVLLASDVNVNSWADALNRGVYDVLPKPLKSKDVIWTVSSAWLSWKERTTRELAARYPLGSRRLGPGDARF